MSSTMCELEFELKDGRIVKTPRAEVDFKNNLLSQVVEIQNADGYYTFKADMGEIKELKVKAKDILNIKVIF